MWAPGGWGRTQDWWSPTNMTYIYVYIRTFPSCLCTATQYRSSASTSSAYTNACTLCFTDSSRWAWISRVKGSLTYDKKTPHLSATTLSVHATSETKFLYFLSLFLSLSPEEFDNHTHSSIRKFSPIQTLSIHIPQHVAFFSTSARHSLKPSNHTLTHITSHHNPTALVLLTCSISSCVFPPSTSSTATRITLYQVSAFVCTCPNHDMKTKN